MARQRRKVNMTSISDPRGITLTKSPANRSGFKVTRSEEGAADENPLVAIVLAEDSTAEMAESIRSRFELDGYEISEADDVVSVRQPGSTNENTIPTDIGEGMTALIAASAFAEAGIHAPVGRSEDVAVDCKYKQPVLVQLSFPSKNYPDAKAVCDWLEVKKIDYPEGAVKRTDAGYVIIRHEELATQAEAVDVDLGDHVSGTVSRSDKVDVPQPVYRSVVEQVYGYHSSWEFIDFAVAMANPGYNTKSEDALWILRDVLENITLYSSLGIEDRKVLIKQATDSYATYMINLLDSLPAPVTMQERGDKAPLVENEVMPKKTTKTDEQEVTRSEEDVAAEVVATDDQPITRGELKGLLAEVLAEQVVRTDDEKTGDEVVAASDEVAPVEEETTERSDDPMAAIASAITKIADSTVALNQRMDALETATPAAAEEDDSVTVTRSEVEEDTTTEEEAQRSDNVSPFTGLFKTALQF